jgi:hypothetical protein
LQRLKASLANGGDADSSIMHRIQDFTAKYFALKIYINSIYEIEKAVTLKGWNVIEFHLNSIELQQNICQISGNSNVVGTVRTQNPEFNIVSNVTLLMENEP